MCSAATMRGGTHHVNITVGQCTHRSLVVGVVREDWDPAASNCGASGTPHGWGWCADTGGCLYHGGKFTEWAARTEYGTGDILGLRLDLGLGILTAFKNGCRLGVAAKGLHGGTFCWMVELRFVGDSVSIEPLPFPLPVLSAEELLLEQQQITREWGQRALTHTTRLCLCVLRQLLVLPGCYSGLDRREQGQFSSEEEQDEDEEDGEDGEQAAVSTVPSR